MNEDQRAVVIVSGGSAISPFTTPDAACGEGQPAGSTDSALRERLLAAGFAVYTSPAKDGPGTADADQGFAGFAAPPQILPAELTVNSVGAIDAAGASLVRFLEWLAATTGYRSFDLVGHSMGGLFSRSALRQLRASGSEVQIPSITTLGTPWLGSFAADYAAGDLSRSAVNGDQRFEELLTEFAALVESLPSDNAGRQVARRFLAGPHGWNAAQAGVLDGVKLTLIAGDAFSGSGALGRHDGLVSLGSALGRDLDPEVLPEHSAHIFPDAHSIFLADTTGLPWHRALTWDPDVADVVITALARP